jgi:hypothetical protein
MSSMARKWLRISTVLFVLILISLEASAFELDLSRRRRKVTEQAESKIPSTVTPQNKAVTDYMTGSETRQEIVILNTDKGFVPSRLSLKRGGFYTVHIVNVNQKEKNVSFILDAFSEHHSTFYGSITSFDIKPAQEGVFSYQCPETSSEGKLIVIANEPPTRGLATESE